MIADAVFLLGILAWAALRWSVLSLLPGIPVAGVFLVVDLGTWDLDRDDLQKRRGLGLLGLLSAFVIAGRAIEKGRDSEWLVFALALAGLSLVAILLITWASGVVARCTRERTGGGGGLDVDSSCKPPEGGGTSGWVGRRRI